VGDRGEEDAENVISLNFLAASFLAPSPIGFSSYVRNSSALRRLVQQNQQS